MLLKLQVKLKTLTPMFLSGEDGKTPEPRSPSFRGALRYWLRAGLGGVLGDDIELVKKKEASVFGSSEKEIGISPIWIRLSAGEYNTNYTQPLLPHRGEIWTNYQKKQLKNSPRPAIPPGTPLTLTLILKPRGSPEILEIATWSLLLLVAFGGVGKRSRRGFGSLRINSIEEMPEELKRNTALKECLNEAQKIAADRDKLAAQIKNLHILSRHAFEQFSGKSGEAWSKLPKFSLLAPDTEIFIWCPRDNSQTDYKSALKALMLKLSGKMADNPKEFAEAFGGIKPRRASPLWVSAHQLQNEWALVLTDLRAEMLENRPGNKHNLVTQFLKDLPKDEVIPLSQLEAK
ncbi:MAG: type III-B CRISPR module RAMP protein Cmr1 [Deltaproteobacteria bacterium]|nr:type III-B CRISPR module RAMP protein Cmr1 [Deltaproteobacteria bacterium]